MVSAGKMMTEEVIQYYTKLREVSRVCFVGGKGLMIHVLLES
jgi:hypothetical protein